MGSPPLEIVLLLRQREDTADDALDVPERIAAQTLFPNFIQPALHGVRPNFLEPGELAECLEVIFPNIAVTFKSRGPLVLLHPREINLLHEIPHREDAAEKSARSNPDRQKFPK